MALRPLTGTDMYTGNYLCSMYSQLQEKEMVMHYASLDRSKPLTGLEYHIDDVFRKCVQVAPPLLGILQLGLSESLYFSLATYLM